MGKLIILTGPTASGKDAIMHNLLKKFPEFERIITVTTRAPRDLERDGIDYYFISRSEFEKKKKNGDFLEINQYGGNWYGTPKKEFKKIDSREVIWRVDSTMAGGAKNFFLQTFPKDQAKKLIDATVVIYLTCSIEIEHKRLKERGMSAKEIEKRIAQDQINWEGYKDKFDFVVNSEGSIDQTIEKVVEIIQKN